LSLFTWALADARFASRVAALCLVVEPAPELPLLPEEGELDELDDPLPFELPDFVPDDVGVVVFVLGVVVVVLVGVVDVPVVVVGLPVPVVAGVVVVVGGEAAAE
jgi:hypothetical protein